MKIQLGTLLKGILLSIVVLVMSNARVYAGPVITRPTTLAFTRCSVDMRDPEYVVDSAEYVGSGGTTVLVENGGELNMVGGDSTIAVKSGGIITDLSGGGTIYLESGATIENSGSGRNTVYKERGASIDSSFTSNASNTVINCPNVNIRE